LEHFEQQIAFGGRVFEAEDGTREGGDDLAGRIVEGDTEVNDAFGVGAGGLLVAAFADGGEGGQLALGCERTEGAEEATGDGRGGIQAGTGLEADADESAAGGVGEEEGGVAVGHAEVDGLAGFASVVEHGREGGALEMEVGWVREGEAVEEAGENVGTRRGAAEVAACLEAGHGALDLGDTQLHALGDLGEGERLALAGDPLQQIEAAFEGGDDSGVFAHDIFYCQGYWIFASCQACPLNFVPLMAKIR